MPDSPRDAILGAAIQILHDHGAGALTVRSVASAAGCSTTGVYTYFGGKHGLVEAIFVDGFQRFGEALTAAGGPGRPLDAMANAYRGWALANPTHYMVMFGRAVPDLEPGQDALLTAYGTFELLVDATSTAMGERGVDGDPLEIAMHLWAGIHGYVSLEISGMDVITDTGSRDRRFATGWLALVSSWLPSHAPATRSG